MTPQENNLLALLKTPIPDMSEVELERAHKLAHAFYPSDHDINILIRKEIKLREYAKTTAR